MPRLDFRIRMGNPLLGILALKTFPRSPTCLLDRSSRCLTLPLLTCLTDPRTTLPTHTARLDRRCVHACLICGYRPCDHGKEGCEALRPNSCGKCVMHTAASSSSAAALAAVPSSRPEGESLSGAGRRIMIASTLRY